MSHSLSPPDTRPTLLQLTHLVTHFGKKVEIIKYIAPEWKTVAIHMNFDPTGYTINIIAASNPLNPVACCTDMIMEWLGGKGRQPATWATLVKVLRNAEFTVLADDVEQLVPSLVREREGEEEGKGEGSRRQGRRGMRSGQSKCTLS